MQSRREPLLWLQCLAIGVIPLELLLIRLLLAGADPGPVPIVERLLIWGVGVVAPAIALWQRPADWGSLLLLRLPVASRSSDQLRLSASESQWGSRSALVGCTVLLLPLLWWLDESAGLIHEFSPLQGSSRLVSLLLTAPLLALLIWQIQQLVQAVLLLVQAPQNDSAAEPWSLDQLRQERTSFGLQLLQFAPLTWPEPVEPTPSPTPEPPPVSTPEPSNEPEPTPEPTNGPDQEPTSDVPEDTASIDAATSEDDSAVATALIDIDITAAIEPEQAAEEEESTPLDPEVGDLDAVASGSTEEHGEQSQAGGGEQREPDQTPEPTPGGA
ncbi:putative conserved membrane protein [Synechococcus sp. A15-24]|nr:putative conserved membrane protein [Synechococcus sp. A15-24]